MHSLSRSLNVQHIQAKNYNGVDLIKFLCAILVFMIHIPPFREDTPEHFWLVQYLCRLAVPFYFVSSGFFLFRKMPIYELNIEIIQNYCSKILRLIGVWTILLFVGRNNHLWYLHATVIAVILVSLCLYFRIRFRYICILACLLYTIGLMGDSYHGLFEPLAEHSIFQYISKGYTFAFHTTRNGVFMGFIFIPMGIAFTYFKFGVTHQFALIGFTVSMFLMFIEALLLKRNEIPADHNMYICLLPATFFLFSLASTIQLKDRAIFKHLRNIGTLIYFSHILVHEFVLLAIAIIDNYWDCRTAQFEFILSFILTFLFAVFIDWLSCKDKFKWLHWLLA